MCVCGGPGGGGGERLLLGEVNVRSDVLGKQAVFQERKKGSDPRLEGPMLIGAEKFRIVGGALCCSWGRGIKFGEGQVAEEGESVADPCGVILSLDSGASLAGFTAQLCRKHS